MHPRTVIAGVTLILALASCSRERVLSADFRDDSLPWSEGDFRTDELSGVWRTRYRAPLFSFDSVSSSGTGVLRINAMTGEFVHTALFFKEFSGQLVPTLQLQDVGEVSFNSGKGILHLSPFLMPEDAQVPEVQVSFLEIKDDELIRAFNGVNQGRGHCDWSDWVVNEPRALMQTPICVSAFPEASWIHVQSVSRSQLILEFCSQKSARLIRERDCRVSQYFRLEQ